MSQHTCNSSSFCIYVHESIKHLLRQQRIPDVVLRQGPSTICHLVQVATVCCLGTMRGLTVKPTPLPQNNSDMHSKWMRFRDAVLSQSSMLLVGKTGPHQRVEHPVGLQQPAWKVQAWRQAASVLQACEAQVALDPASIIF